MKRLLRMGIVSLAAAIVLFAAFHCMQAQSSGQGGHKPPSSSQTNDPDKNRPLTLLKTYMTQGFYATGYWEEAGEDLPIDSPTTFTCPWTGCTLEIEQTVQVSGIDSDDEWALGVRVDDSWLYSPFEGYLPNDDFVVGTFHQSIALGPGKHRVQSFIWSDFDGLWLCAYHMNYRIYIP